MTSDPVTIAYAIAGLLLPVFYVPQIRACLRDNTELRSFSVSKCATQTVMRAAMLPFVVGVGNNLMTFIVALDFVARSLELAAALWSLNRQGWGWRRIFVRIRPRLLAGASAMPTHTGFDSRLAMVETDKPMQSDTTQAQGFGWHSAQPPAAGNS